ncbi:hypothetical protein EKO04_001693 [Ascochyta lentis]|uniref:Uncharacterized protein n=1 Tax=Ascochyta lentis TaxID=205686 RepID=A0A8H7JDP7_9PLEO|nr:hypothetical protein EKO04_001693 [Ascochyta lentis]
MTKAKPSSPPPGEITGDREPMLHNPTDPANWPSDPATLEELETQWIPETRTALLKWLQDAKIRATQSVDKERLETYKQALTKEWVQWEPRTDPETGDFASERLMEAYEAASGPKMDVLDAEHKRLHTWHKHMEYRYAQAAWEDFLYFQNVWNRRTLARDEEFDGTMGEALKSKREAPGVKNKGKTARTTLQEYSDEEPLKTLQDNWRIHVVSLYSKFELGSRKLMPKKIGPEIAHRYSQPLRGTTPLKLSIYKYRHDRLEHQFPRYKEKGGDYSQEDVRMTEDQMKRAMSKERTLLTDGKMIEIAWTLDQEAFAREKARRDRTYSNCPRTKYLLHKNHVLHHGVLEKSFDWPTSFDADNWGNIIAVTASKREYVYEEEEYLDEHGLQRKRHTKDEKGSLIRATEICGYKKTKGTKLVEAFIHDLNEDGSVKGRKADGSWIGRTGKINELSYDHVLINDEKVPDLRYRSKNVFRTIKIESKWPRITRYQRHLSSTRVNPSTHGDALVDQLSDNEAEDCTKGNLNFSRSGNINARQSGEAVGNPQGNLSGASGTGPDLPVDDSEFSESDDEESDDEGDLFTQSYLH